MKQDVPRGFTSMMRTVSKTAALGSNIVLPAIYIPQIPIVPVSKPATYAALSKASRRQSWVTKEVASSSSTCGCSANFRMLLFQPTGSSPSTRSSGPFLSRTCLTVKSDKSSSTSPRYFAILSLTKGRILSFSRFCSISLLSCLSLPR